MQTVTMGRGYTLWYQHPSNWDLQTAAGKHILIISLNYCFYTGTTAFTYRDFSPSLPHVNKFHYKAEKANISNIDERFGLGELPSNDATEHKALSLLDKEWCQQ